MTDTKDQPDHQMRPSHAPAVKPVLEPDLRSKLDVIFWHFYSEYGDLANTVKAIVDELNLIRPLFLGTDHQPGMLDQMRALTAKNAQNLAELGRRLDETVSQFDVLDRHFDELVSHALSEAFLEEKAQQLILEVSGSIGIQVLRDAQRELVRETYKDIQNDLQQLRDSAEVRSTLTLSAENQALKRELEATKQQLATAEQNLAERGFGYMQNVMIAAVLGCIVGASIVHVLPHFLKQLLP